MRSLVLYNPSAGRGRGSQAASLVAAALERQGWRVRTLRTRAAGDAESWVARFGPWAQRAIVIGGDGTLREVAVGLIGSGQALELGFIPLGNANVVARSLGIPLNIEGAVHCAVHGHARGIDVLSAEGRIALAMVGIGYDAHVARRLAAARNRPFTGRWYAWNGDSLYGFIGGTALVEWKPVRFAVEADGRLHQTRYGAAVISNLETYAKGWAMTPGADPCDGKLDWMARKRMSAPFGALSLACAALRRRAPTMLADYGQARRIVIHGEGPLAWQADGDYLGTSERLEVAVLAQALQILVPA